MIAPLPIAQSTGTTGINLWFKCRHANDKVGPALRALSTDYKVTLRWMILESVTSLAMVQNHSAISK